MPQAKGKRKARTRRSYSEEFKQEAVQMVLDGHSAPSVAERLGLSGANVVYRWKKDSLRRADRQSGGPHRCGETDNVTDALKLIKATHSDLVVVDISLQGGSGLDLIKQVTSRGERPKLLVSSMYDDNLYAERAIRAGALRYINKQEVPEKVLDAIRHVLAGDIYLSPEMSQRLLRRTVRGKTDLANSPVAALSDRELEVFTQIGHGKPTRQIAEELDVSIKTVETHRENIQLKLGLANAAELARQAVQWVLENG